jgi:hypothetical protein
MIRSHGPPRRSDDALRFLDDRREFDASSSDAGRNVRAGRGCFEPDEVALAAEYLERSDVFVDIGSNIGFYSRSDSGTINYLIVPVESS